MKQLTLTLALLSCATAHAQTAPAPASAPADDVDIAKAHFNTGEAYYEHGRFVDAAREFEEAYRLSQKAPLLYNVGKSYDAANDFARALDAYQRFLAAAAPDNRDRDFAGKRVELLQTLVGKVALDGAVDGSVVTLDDKPLGTTPLAAPLVVNPGRHQLAVAHEGYATFKSAVDVPVGGAASVAVKQTEAIKVVTVAGPAAAHEKDTPVYKKWWLWTAVGGAVVVAGVITAVVVTSDSSNHGLPTVQLPQVK
jgi:tetratricopeptide (TPR) repeat protein